MNKKMGVLFILLGSLILLCGFTRSVLTDTEPYFITRDSFKTEEGYFVILQPVSPIQFVAQVTQLDQLPLKGEGQQCKLIRQTEQIGDKSLNKLHLTCKKWEGDLNTVVFPPR